MKNPNLGTLQANDIIKGCVVMHGVAVIDRERSFGAKVILIDQGIAMAHAQAHTTQTTSIAVDLA